MGKIEITIPPEVINEIAERIAALLYARDERQPQEDFLDVEEAASFLGTTREQIYQWTSQSRHGQSDFPYLKAGKSLKFSRPDLTIWMKKHGKPEKGGS